MAEEDVVRFAQIELPNGNRIAHAELNVPGTLNSLSLEMIDLIAPKLASWRADQQVVAVLFSGAGGRAFCAGGDIQALYHAMCENHAAGEVVNTYPFEFFEREYRLDYAIHQFPKPVVVLGHGVVMGGGLGILSGASHRVLTERSRVALPEITIGLFPDAGTTWLLKNMPEHLALFTGMTGSHSNAADAMACGVGTVVVDSGELEALQAGLGQLDLTGDRVVDDAVLTDYFAQAQISELPESALADVPSSLNADGSLTETVSMLRELKGRNDFLDKCLAAMEAGCPTSIGVVHEQIRRARTLSQEDAFRMEMVVATHCATNKDFAEGVRALLIDKDNRPQWQPASLDELDSAHVLSHFEPPWSENPLADLG